MTKENINEQQRCRIDGVEYRRIPFDRNGEPAFLDNGGPNPDFDWEAFRGKSKMTALDDDYYYTHYRRTQIAEMTPWVQGMNTFEVSISQPDLLNGSPKVGDMIARNPKNHADKWLVSAQYFADNFEPMS